MFRAIIVGVAPLLLGAISGSAPDSTKRVDALRDYAQANGFSTHYGLFSDLGRFSGDRRFYIIDFQAHAIVHAGLVTHGHCKEDKKEVRFSNTPGSNCSSAGKYSVGESYIGNFGLAFKLHGLDVSNRNAFKRFIVMHAHECVYDGVRSHEICESEGCPTVSKGTLNKIQALVRGETKPLLLWVYKDDGANSQTP